MQNTLLFHIGKMKTGTSALQLFLYNNADRLKQYGWCYPDLGNELPEIKAWNVINKGKNGTIFYTTEGRIDEFSDNWNKPWELILNYLKNYNVIISSEDISNRDTAKFLKLAKEMYKNIKVVIYLRRQDRAVESEWNQEIKAGQVCDSTINEFISEEVLERLHYLKLLDQISDIIGKSNLIIKVYEKRQYQGVNQTIMSDFLSILEINPNWREWEVCNIQNPRLYSNYFELKKIFNKVYSLGYNEDYAALYANVFMKISQEFSENKEEAYFTRKEREEFLEQFEIENKIIAENYLKREDGILFYDDRMEFDLIDSNIYTSSEKDIVRLFSALILAQSDIIRFVHQELENIKNQNNNLANKLLMRIYNEKEIILFGAGNRCRKLLMNHIITHVSFIVDNDNKKNGETLCGVKILYAMDFIDWLNYFVIVTCEETNEIEQQLHEIGLKKEENYVLAKEYFV